ncbi:tetratricopeptide repeat protein [Robiginitalea sp. M39]|uniref:Tetratricopeptide repeat protein n=2 Tax=Robiginitalea aurantiaca TaxID=3056915 RepID=A0ABT7WBB4_9FLAO|nr:tetratricopeptide repeat protein [Robiginitalea aurantiaca]MDM9630207.1 tetratricopeptide repeat protein [Robiginitalea aurantiaca]
MGQQDFLAQQYYNDGDFDKAVVFYEKLVESNPRRLDFADQLVRCYQQLEQYDKAIAFLEGRIRSGTAHPTVYIDMGYTYDLMGIPDKREEAYQKAKDLLESNPDYGYVLGFKFQQYTLLDNALWAYKRSMELNPELDYNTQIARIYGEQGEVGKMYEAYMDLLSEREAIKPNVLRVLQSFVTSDPQNENNLLLRKTLLTRAQKDPNPLWNELLSWLFIEQGQLSSALGQEKAIYRRSEGGNLDRIISLGRLAEDRSDLEAARDAFEFIESESGDPLTQLNAKLHLIDISLLEDDSPNLDRTRRAYESLLEQYGYDAASIQLQISYANFLAFRMDQADEAIEILKKSLEQPLSEYTEGYVKLNLGDILVYTRRFNEALILFTQVQKGLKNDVMAQQARFKVAQTSFYKGDFDWALTQLKVLRNSTSQLIANDAMQLSLIISDNSIEDSTQTALRKYARADLLSYQKKQPEALEVLEELLISHKGERIEDEALLMQGKLLEETNDFSGARLSYLKITEFFGTDILADDAHFALAELYRIKLDEPEKAMEHYREIIFRFQDSYYFPQARKEFRILRGDPVN